MSTPPPGHQIEARIDAWRDELRRRGHDATDIAALEAGLRAHLPSLVAAGLSEEEAFVVGALRVGASDGIASGHAIDHATRPSEDRTRCAQRVTIVAARTWREASVVLALAIGAAVAIKAPELFGLAWGVHEAFYARNLGLFVFPFLALYFGWKRGLGPASVATIGAAFAAAAVAANLHASRPEGWLDVLVAIHLPIALWLAVGIAHAGGRWSDLRARMDFVRFSGELFVYYVLIALGGGVLTGLTAAMLGAIGIDFEPLFERWVLPCGAMGAAVVAAWLVEARQGVAESLAPMLARLFAPLFAVVLLGFLATMAVTGRAFEFHRDLLIAFDALLVVVLGLLLYSMTARDPDAPPGAFDVLQVVLLASALLVDAVALWTIASRISELGFTPNRVAVLGENLVLLVNLAGSALLYLRFLRGRGGFAALERWQACYLPVYAAWAAIVVVLFPLLFR